MCGTSHADNTWEKNCIHGYSPVWMFSECCCVVLGILNHQMHIAHLHLSKLADNYSYLLLSHCTMLALGSILKFNTYLLLDWDDSQNVGVLLPQSSYYAFAQEYVDGLWSPETRALYQLLAIKTPKSIKITPTHFSVESKDDFLVFVLSTHSSVSPKMRCITGTTVFQHFLLCESQLIVQNSVSFSEEINCGNTKTCPKRSTWVLDKIR